MTNKQKEFLKLYEPVHADFERFCRARVFGDMDFRDLMNETLMKAFEKFDTLRSKEAFLHFLFGISVRVLANNHRKKKAVVGTFEAISPKLEDTNANTESKTEVHFLHKALAELPEVQREAIILFEITGFSIKEIAVLQESSETSVKQRLRRGRLKLRAILTFNSSDGQSEPNTGGKTL